MKIPKRVASTVINSLKGGVVPRTGLSYITVGRKAEIDAILHDVDIVADGGAAFRFIEGRYGSGKSFLLQAVRNYVMDRGFVVIDADLSPERRLHGNKGQGLATYRELIGNMSTRTRPEGGALKLVLDRWIASMEEGIPYDKGGVEHRAALEAKVSGTVLSMDGMVHGYDFGKVIAVYCRAYSDDDADAQARVLRWLRGEYQNRTEAKREIGVNAVITDDDWYDYVKLFAVFLRGIGYSGLIMLVDELVNIYKIPNRVARESNYEKILTMYNDVLQGRARYLGIIMSGTPECIENPQRGVYSYEALRSRLADGRFSQDGRRDMLAPVIRLEPLTYEEMTVLVERLADIHAVLFGYERTLTEQDLADFIRTEYSRIGADSRITPREVIRDFIELLDIMHQHPGTTVKGLLGSDEFEYAKGGPEGDGDEIPEFEIRWRTRRSTGTRPSSRTSSIGITGIPCAAYRWPPRTRYSTPTRTSC